MNQTKGHAEVLVRRERCLMKMWQLHCRLVSCMLQQCSAWQYVYMFELVVVLQVMSSVDVLAIMHMFARSKNSAGFITRDSTE